LGRVEPLSPLLLQEALKSPPVRKLYQRACDALIRLGRKPNISVKIVPEGTMPFHADTLIDEIRIWSTCSQEEAINLLIFELSNVLHCNEFNDLWTQLDRMKGGIVSPQTIEYFVKQAEKIEYDGYLESYQVIQQAYKELDYPFKPAPLPTFEEVWPTLQKQEHAAYWRQAITRQFQ
jgi:hypothetical protein